MVKFSTTDANIKFTDLKRPPGVLWELKALGYETLQDIAHLTNAELVGQHGMRP